jgi:magnesium transporter
MTQAKPGRRRGSGTAAAGSSGTRRTSTRPSASRQPPEDEQGSGVDGRLFDATGPDRDVPVTRRLVRGLGEHQMLWVDIDDPDDPGLARIAELFGLEHDTASALGAEVDGPSVTMFPDHLLVTVEAIDSDKGRERTVTLSMLASTTYVVTVHREAIPFLDAFREHFGGDTRIGLVDGPDFLTALLDWHLTGYFQAIDGLEHEADRLDQRALDPRSQRDLLSDLVQLRRRIAVVRRALGSHREVFAVLTRPELTGFVDPDDTTHFRALAERLDRAIDGAETARELVVGSFDVHMTRTAQRTNEVMKLLTLATVILLPASILAGIMGMNFRVGFFDNAGYFWVVLAIMAAIAVGTLIVARIKGWI